MNIWRIKTPHHLQLLSAIIGGKLLELIRIPSVPQLPPLLGFEAFEESLFKVGYWSLPHGGMFNCCCFPLPYEFSLAMGISVGVLCSENFICLGFPDSFLLNSASLLGFVWFSSTTALKLLPIRKPGQCFVLGAVSPAVVVPSMLLLQENGYGINKGIPTLLIAASSLDDIIAITGFNTCLSIVFSSGGILNNVLASFRDVLIGVLAGAVLGIFVQYFPSGDQTKLPLKRAFLILSMCVTAVLGSHHIGLHAAGGLCTLALTFVAGINWSTEKVKVQRIIKTTWYIFQPLLFGLVGSEVSVASLQSNAIGICVATMSLALLVRISFTFVLMCFAGFSFKEKIFIALSWMPKATVQAVLGPLALETARSSAPHLEPYSKDVMTVAFLAILITAPNGALIIGILGPKVLTRHDPNKVDVELTKLELH
uniref:sodium/hydrogen exchanger 9B1 isoform X7 n=1 Tax=Halichoerus grypus TaxID=9711 RepID=UPI0016592035|nr:sodium/hydrogen exchanger 9B1 isoform X7 [Halichoerus grypus]